ncbi:MAG: type II toxin-antitoxin system MqsA family antitoxin [Myxococcota bacterium]
METTNAPKCPDCGAVMARDERRLGWTHKGQTVEFSQPGWFCPVDGTHDHVLDEADTLATEPLRLAHRVVVEGGLHPAEVKRIRERLGMSQREAGRVIGGGPIAFHKYERGVVATTHALGVLLRLLDRHPEMLAELRGEFGGKAPKGARVEEAA